MRNAVGREIPDSLLVNGKEVYQGKNYMDGKYIQKASPRTRRYEKSQESKIVETLADALRQCGAKDGMTFSFHHHLRDGDYVVNMVMKAAIEELGLKDLTIAASSLGSAHDPIADYIEEGKVIGIQTSGIRGRMGEVVSAGKLKTPAIIRSHGGRPRAIEAGEVHIDIAFVAAPTSDCVGNCRGIGGKSNCGSMGYAMTDAKYADHVVVVTDCLVDFPNMPASVEAIDVDAVVVVDSIGNPKKIASAAARISQNPRDLMMAENVAKVIASTPYFKDGFSFQTGVGGPSLAANLFLEQYMDERNIKMGWAIGGICGPMVELLKKGKVGKVIDVQDFDLDAVNSINQTPNHFEMSASQYAKATRISQLGGPPDYTAKGDKGEDVEKLGGVFGTTRDLYKEFGTDRIRNTPISESAIVGAALGAACAGMRPIAELMYWDFAFVAADQIFNQMAKTRYVFGGNAKIPMVLRSQQGTGRGNAATHSQSLESIFMHIPGLKVVCASTATDAKGRKLKVHKLCLTKKPCLLEGADTIDAVEGTIPREDGEVSIASYMNFLIVNGAVILPQYGDENDAVAIEQVQKMFPDREVVGVQTKEVAFGGGNIHCITQQQPAVKK